MDPVTKVEGLAAPLDRADVDTDQVIPKNFLKRVERTGYGDFLFHDWRFHGDGRPREDFVLNRPEYQGARVLVTGRNFGCGSSREHACWALKDYGFQAVIAPSFADIFKSNCFQNGMIPVVVEDGVVTDLIGRIERGPSYRLVVDLRELTVSDDDGVIASFQIDPFRRECLLKGWDDIGLTLQWENEISAFEREREPAWGQG